MSANLKFWGVVSAVLLAYGLWTLAVVLSARTAKTQEARVLACDTRPGGTGGFPVGPLSEEVLVTITTEFGPPGEQRRQQFEFSRAASAGFECSDLSSVQIQVSPLRASAAYLAGAGTTPEDLVKGSLAVIVGALFAAGVRQRHLRALGAP
ncbi:MAG: hypothetical protein SXG53_22890 [Pseudomonadota bacterium]|nr:hypothetical protein [Pseudomonadota bacterium]